MDGSGSKIFITLLMRSYSLSLFTPLLFRHCLGSLHLNREIFMDNFIKTALESDLAALKGTYARPGDYPLY